MIQSAVLIFIGSICMLKNSVQENSKRVHDLKRLLIHSMCIVQLDRLFQMKLVVCVFHYRLNFSFSKLTFSNVITYGLHLPLRLELSF